MSLKRDYKNLYEFLNKKSDPVHFMRHYERKFALHD